MGQQTLALFGGGAVLLTPSSNTTLVWWLDRRVQTIRASAPSLVMTMQPAADAPNLPWGVGVIVLNPSDSGQSFTLRNTPTDSSAWSFTMAPGKATLVTRVKNGGTAQSPTPQWWPTLWNIK